MFSRRRVIGLGMLVLGACAGDDETRGGGPTCDPATQCVTPPECQLAAGASCVDGVCVYQAAPEHAPCRLDVASEEPDGFCRSGVCCGCGGAATQECAVAHGSGAQSRTCSATGWSEWGECLATTCDPGYEPSGSECVWAAGDIFNVYFELDFQQRDPGPYTDDEIAADWLGGGGSYQPELVTIEDEAGNRFLENAMPAGQMGLSESGLDWYMTLPDASLSELYVSYRMKFSENMATEYTPNPDGDYPLHWLSGKAALGLYTNHGWGGAGTRPGPDEGFFVLQMFDTRPAEQVATKFYVYDQNTACLENCEDGDPDNDVYWGGSFPTGALLEANVWYDVTYRIALNDPWTDNGLLEYFVDGNLLVSYDTFRFRDTEAVTIEILNFANFLGGSGTVPTLDGWWAFDDIILFDYNANAPDVPRGTTPSDPDRVLLTP